MPPWALTGASQVPGAALPPDTTPRRHRCRCCSCCRFRWFETCSVAAAAFVQVMEQFDALRDERWAVVDAKGSMEEVHQRVRRGARGEGWSRG